MIIARKKKNFLPTILALLTIVAFGLTLKLTPTTNAISGWQAGNIMDDAVMANKNTMTVSQIQSFLNNKVPSCDTYGQQLSEYGGPDLNGDGKVQRWEWGKANYNQTTFTCLKNYSQGGRSAAQIIYDASQTYSINPQVLLVLLQKEQGLIQDTWPLNIQYRSATGYGCPDTAPCDSDYYGLTNQIKWAATMFRSILDDSPTWYTPYELGWNYIQYNPSSSCGGSNVYIENRATQALYNYTPYQPNQAALDAGWGTVSCGAYGNRNFYLYFTSWFGSTRELKFIRLETPRWMELKLDTYKKNPVNDENIDMALPAGMQLKFTTKIYLNGRWYLRTQWDTDHNLNKGVPLSNIENIPYEAFDEPRWMELKESASKLDPRTGKTITDNFNRGLDVYFDSKIRINGQWYFRTKYNSENNTPPAFPADAIGNIKYSSLETPRWFRATSNTSARNTTTSNLSTTQEVAAKGTDVFFDTKLELNGVWYFRSKNSSDTNSKQAFPASDFKNVPIHYVSLQEPRWFRLKQDLYKQNPETNEPVNSQLPAGMELYFPSKLYIGGQWYLRTKWDSDHNLNQAIPLVLLENTN